MAQLAMYEPCFEDPFGRLHGGVQRGVPALHDDEAAKPPLLPGDLRAGGGGGVVCWEMDL